MFKYNDKQYTILSKTFFRKLLNNIVWNDLDITFQNVCLRNIFNLKYLWVRFTYKYVTTKTHTRIVFRSHLLSFFSPRIDCSSFADDNYNYRIVTKCN